MTIKENIENTAITNENNAMVEFLNSEQAISVMENIRDLKHEIDSLKAQETAMRQSLEALMNIYGIKSFENDILKVTYKAATTRKELDSKKLKSAEPEVWEKYSRLTPVKESVTIKVKEDTIA